MNPLDELEAEQLLIEKMLEDDDYEWIPCMFCDDDDESPCDDCIRAYERELGERSVG
jgi:hypothetical protein